jgi:Fe-S-cluster-containing hydrogenase component 2
MSGECLKVCPHRAFIVKDGKASIVQSKCDQDGICIPACPNGAIYAIREDEYIPPGFECLA